MPWEYYLLFFHYKIKLRCLRFYTVFSLKVPCKYPLKFKTFQALFGIKLHKLILLIPKGPFLPLEPETSAKTRKYMFFAMVRRTNQGAAFYVIKTQAVSDLTEFSEFVRMNKAFNRQVFFCGLKILTDRDDVHSIICKVPDGLDYFFFFLTETKHNSTFGAHAPFF